MAPHDDFILTISDNDVLSDLDPSDSEPAPAKANIGKKRKRESEFGQKTGKSSKKARKSEALKKQSSTQVANLRRDEQPSSAEEEEEQGTHDGAIDSDFEFDVGPGQFASATEDFDGWDFEGRPRQQNQQVTKTAKKAVDIDEIIARRASAKHKPQKASANTPADVESSIGVEIEKVLEEGGYEDEDEQEDDDEEEEEEEEEVVPDFENDELLAMDGFGAGAESENGDIEQEDTNTDALAENAEESDNDSVASPTAHPDDLASADDDDDDSIAARDDPEEIAKRAAFFAPEEKNSQTEDKAMSKSGTNSFQSFSLSRPLLRGVAAVNYSSPTPIQKRAIPVALAGKDVVGSAVTGSGKTAAFLLPILERLLYRPRKVPTTRVAILLPTRELAVQCYNVAQQLAQFTDVTFAQLVGGFSIREQEALLKRRPDIVIATPGRFIDHMRNSASFVVENLEILVLDEADRMLEDGFADELDEILRTIPRGRQTMLFSATMTESVDKLVRVGMNRPVRISVDAQNTTVQGLVQEFVRLRPGREDKRMSSLLLLCTQVYTERVIVFFRQKKEVHRARIIFGLLGVKASELHGGMSQEQRINAVASFRSGSTTHLLATDLASRGLDIKNVLTVINYEAPQSHEIYLHRVGRTARAGKSGRACTIAAEPDRKIVKSAVKSAKTQGAKVVSRVLEVGEVDAMYEKLQTMEEEIEEVLKEEQQEKQLAQADMQLTKGENIVKHQSEIMARPKRTWFESEKEKRSSKKAGRAELNGPESVAAKKHKGRLSGKDKKRLDDRRERVEGSMWRKGKGSEEAVKAERRQSKAKKAAKSTPGAKGSKGRKVTKR